MTLLPALVAGAMALTLDDPPAARRLVAEGAAVLDARDYTRFLFGHIPGAAAASWRVGVVGGWRSGLLGPPAEAAAAFAALGVRSDRPVLVVGDWTSSWGEEGRVAWDLEYLGHPDVHVLRGGMVGWTGPTEIGPTWPAAGAFTPRVRPELRADRAQVRRAGLVVDVRARDEFAGNNFYLAAYGGHIPGALNLPWGMLADGAPVPPSEEPVVLYCTGGVRSAFVWMLLTAQGRPAANYDGGWWDWAANEPAAPGAAPG